jgi:hypothetical protein
MIINVPKIAGFTEQTLTGWRHLATHGAVSREAPLSAHGMAPGGRPIFGWGMLVLNLGQKSWGKYGRMGKNHGEHMGKLRFSVVNFVMMMIIIVYFFRKPFQRNPHKPPPGDCEGDL